MSQVDVGLCFKKELALKVKERFPFIFERANNSYHSENGDILLIHKETSYFNSSLFEDKNGKFHSFFLEDEAGKFYEFLRGFDSKDYLILAVQPQHKHSPSTRIDCGKWYDNPFNFFKSMKVSLEYNFASWSLCRQGENCPCPNCEVKRLYTNNSKD